ncbi:MAG: hypothetical protein IPK58_24840 [Acidobacteria bacterium]|nr:hypothetical protein [Acidobacteriota bacterium]
MLDSFENQSRTFYRGINRLPSASSLALGRNGAKLTTYWTLDPEREIRLKSDAEYSEQFRAHFYESVRCRLRSAFPVGAMLSGGLDSSSIACAAYELHDPAHSGPLHTFPSPLTSQPER